MGFRSWFACPGPGRGCNIPGVPWPISAVGFAKQGHFEDLWDVRRIPGRA